MQRRTLLKTFAAFAAPLAALPQKLFAAPGLPSHDERIRCFGQTWLVRTAGDWKTELAPEGDVLHLDVPRPQEANPRAPVQYALLDSQAPGCFTLDVEVRSDLASASLIVVYAWKDPVHFNYVHLSTDAARKQPVHNGVFHVYGGDRVRISNDEGVAALAPATKWTAVHIVYDAAAHLVETWIDGQLNPSLRAVDFSLGSGSIGLGSFFDTGNFRKFSLKPGACRPFRSALLP
jgi:hypothetical protein